MEVDIKLGTFLDNTRRRADRLTPERRAELDRLGMRWEQPTRRTGGEAGLAASADSRATRRYAGRLEQGQVGSWPFL
ncbi:MULTISPECIES: helicase associated domain-containing protein [unclassified Streptomyces]|uniref:helicase associated domain-containing protein n=1 Tax=unclassified Streptomyces TaxID=2593676 RepID=UPI0005692C94|nr:MULTISPECIES: helicase associated domain-containing protein [unclassified Streptomyces]